MAQNSDALQEPSMDELLASIREIIEENTGIPQQDGQDRAAFKNGNMNGSARAPQSHEAGQGHNKAGFDGAIPHLKQDIRLRNDRYAAPPISRPQSAFVQPGGEAYPAQPQNSQGARREQGRWEAAQPSDEINMAPQARNGALNGAGRPVREAYPALPAQDAAFAQESRPVQDSMNALAERIGLRRGAPTAYNEGQSKPAQPQADHNFAPLPSMAQPVRGGAAPAGVAAGNNGQYGRAPFGQESGYAHKDAAPQANNNAGDMHSRFNPAAVSARYHDNNEAQEKPVAFPMKETGRAAPMPQQKASAEPAGEMRGAAGSAAFAQEQRSKLTEIEKSLPADVEHSTENLLRPFITQWLDEHFRGLFEKILREEVQRFVQSMQRRS